MTSPAGSTGAVGIVWFRRDLRVDHNPALLASCSHPKLLPVFIWTPGHQNSKERPFAQAAPSLEHSRSQAEAGGSDEAAPEWARYPGAASRWWLHHSLQALDASLRERGSALTFCVGEPLTVLQALVRSHASAVVYWNRQYDPISISRDTHIKEVLRKNGCPVKSFNGSLLAEPPSITRSNKQPYRIFTPFAAALTKSLADAAPLPGHCPSVLPPLPKKLLRADKGSPLQLATLSELNLTPRIRWDKEIAHQWQPGETAARAALRDLPGTASRYQEQRDRPDRNGTSRMSPRLHFGELHPLDLWNTVEMSQPKGASAQSFLRQLVWREFAHHLLFHFPQSLTQPLRPAFVNFPWNANHAHLRAWQQGSTGYPLVDAGMAELWTTGWMHNRVRMVVGSFLTKHLRLHWIHGAVWFMDTLLDADLANNTLGWQWIAGTGADAAPYFRIFNPVTQSEKFDPQGHYIRKWVPALRGLPDRFIHAPWLAPKHVLQSANLRLGDTYPFPIVDHNTARVQALAAFATIKSASP